MLKKMRIKAIQSQLLNLLSDFSNYCATHDISYYLIGGSLLGAVRHKGFIPWDDDIDIGIPRPLYEVLLDNLRLNDELFDFDSYVTNENYVYGFIKVLDTSSEFEFKWHKNLDIKTYLSIDVFPFDGTPNFVLWRYIYVWYVQALISFKNYLYLNSSPRPFLSRIIADLFKKIFKIKPFVLLKFIDNQMKRFPVNSSKYVVNYSGIYGFREIVKREVLGLPTPYDFENQVFYGVENSDIYLTKIYGDYLLIPEEKKRYSHYS